MWFAEVMVVGRPGIVGIRLIILPADIAVQPMRPETNAACEHMAIIHLMLIDRTNMTSHQAALRFGDHERSGNAVDQGGLGGILATPQSVEEVYVVVHSRCASGVAHPKQDRRYSPWSSPSHHGDLGKAVGEGFNDLASLFDGRSRRACLSVTIQALVRGGDGMVASRPPIHLGDDLR